MGFLLTISRNGIRSRALAPRVLSKLGRGWILAIGPTTRHALYSPPSFSFRWIVWFVGFVLAPVLLISVDRMVCGICACPHPSHIGGSYGAWDLYAPPSLLISVDRMVCGISM